MSPRSREQYEEIREKSRQNILLAALEIFAENGYAHASIDQIARKANMAKGSVYHYFGSKEAVFEAVVRNGLSEFEEILEEVHSYPSAGTQLEALITSSFDSILQKKEFWKLYFSLLTQLGLPKSLQQFIGPVLNEMLTLMTRLCEEMGMPDPQLKSKILAATLDGVFLHYLLLGEAYPLEEVRDMIVKNYLRE